MTRRCFPAARLARPARLALIGGCLLMSAACDRLGGTFNAPPSPQELEDKRVGKVTGEEGITFSLGGRGSRESAGATGMNVNSFLWRAALDATSFMPLISADPFGGVIITDWHSPEGVTNERVKVTVYVLDRQLRSDGVRASVFRQARDRTGNWVEAPVNAQTATDLENAILTRARQMRLESVAAPSR